MQALTEYFKLQKEIFDYFGYRQDWKVIPLDDQRESYWMLLQNERGGGRYVYSAEPFDTDSIRAGDNIYGGIIYTQRFLPKWVYRGAEYTMVCADTETDGNKFLMVFSNDRECKDQGLKDLYDSTW